MRQATLRRKPNAEKRIAVLITNHEAARIANAVGLDSPASLLSLLARLRDEGYEVGDLPATPDEFMHAVIDRGHYDAEASGGFGADVIVQMGNHGSLGWLPGKGVGLAADCYPDLFLGDLVVVYPFIIDGPGEGAAAKRRTRPSSTTSRRP